MPTDLPEPVVPATSKCGILPRLAMTGLPLMSAPRTTVSGERSFWYCGDSSTPRSGTISRLRFGISRPMKGRPGMTSTTRTLCTESRRAMSRSRLVMELTLMPGASESSMQVTTGPTMMFSTRTLSL